MQLYPDTLGEGCSERDRTGAFTTHRVFDHFLDPDASVEEFFRLRGTRRLAVLRAVAAGAEWDFDCGLMIGEIV